MSTDDVIEIDLKELLLVLLDKIPIIISITLIFSTVAFGYTKFFIPKQYTASLSMFVKNNHEISTDKQKIELNDINASQELVNAYIEILNDDTVIDTLALNMNKKYGKNYIQNIFGTAPSTNGNTTINTKALKNCITLSSKNETEVLQVTATTTSPVLSSNICNSMADLAPKVLNRVVGTGSVEIIGKAKVPVAPSSPSVTKNTAIGGMLGLLLSCGIIIVIKLLNNTVDNMDKTVDALSLNPLGEIPLYDNNTDEHLTLLNIDDFTTQEAYNSLRTNLIFSLAAVNAKSLIITSALGGDGKSVSSANLAISLARNNAKVLLIDADLRKPVQHRVFNLKNRYGLSTVLSGLSTLENSIFKTDLEKLYVMPSGEIPPNPQELLSSKNMENLLSQLEEIYDYIIFDMPPGCVVSDCQALSRIVPNIILIAASDKTPLNTLKKLIASLSFTNANILGIVVNKLNLQKSTYNKHYKYKYY